MSKNDYICLYLVSVSELVDSQITISWSVSNYDQSEDDCLLICCAMYSLVEIGDYEGSRHFCNISKFLAWHYIPEDSHLYAHHHENLKSYMINCPSMF
jgi:hypothetical protein